MPEFHSDSLFIPTKFEADPGYDSPIEREMALALLNMNTTTGPLAGGVVARIERDANSLSTHLLGWVNPHYYDPVAVKLMSNGKAYWRFADAPESDRNKWSEDFSRNTIAEKVLGELQAHLPPDFAAVARAPAYDA